MILFSFPDFDYAKKQLLKLAGLKAGQFEIERFSNGELYAKLRQPVRNEVCLILATIAPPDVNLLYFLLLANTIKKEGAKKVVAFLPYLAYSRQDKEKSYESLTNAWIGNLFKASGIDQTITIDLHSSRNEQLFPIPILSISPAPIFALEFVKGLRNFTLVSPDEGSVKRIRQLANLLNMDKIVYLKKTRTKEGIEHRQIVDNITSRVVIYDDMLDTGGTLISACRKLRLQGVREIYIMVTHGLFTAGEWKLLFKLGVKKIFCTDTVPKARTMTDKRIKVLSTFPLIARKLKSLI